MPTTEPAWVRHLPAGTDARSVDLTARSSLPAAWAANWNASPHRVVICDDAGDRLTGSDLLERTEVAARRLRHAGLRKRDRIIVSGGICARTAVAHCAALRAGLVVVPVNPAYSKREIDVLLNAARPAGVIAESPEIQECATAAGIAVVVGTDIDLPDGPPIELDDVTSDDPALLPFTSGTTGVPKGAVLSHGNLLASAEALRIAWRWTTDDRLLLCLTLSHMHGLGVGLHGTLLTGASVFLMHRFDPDDVLSAAAEATMFFGIPTMYARLVEAEGAQRLSGLRLCVSGSAPMSAELHRDVEARCGQRVLERYGMTETVMLVSNPYDGERRGGTVGFPLPGVDVRLATDTSEIEVRGPNVFSGYFERPDADAVSFTGDGWFRTGDVGSFDEDGYLSIVGRTKELIITGGYNVFPREVEDVLTQHPSVVDAAVAGTPSAEWGEVVTAFVVTTDGFDEGEVIAWAATQLAPYKKPRIVHRVDAIPRNHMGKILRDELIATTRA